MPDDDERGVADRGTAAGRAAKAGGSGQVNPAEGVDRRSGAGLARDAMNYLDAEAKPNFKVLLAYGLAGRKRRELPAFARSLAERPHAQWGTYLSYFFIVLQADGSRAIAQIVAQWFSDAGLLVVHGERARSISQGAAPASDALVAGAAAERFVYEGRTLIRLGGERFFISGVPGEAYWLSRTTSVIFIYKASAPNKLYRLDFGKYVPKGTTAEVVGWHHNVHRVGKVLGLEGVNHTPVGGWGKAAGQACRIFRAAGRPLFFLGAGLDAYQIYEALDKGRAVARVTGRWVVGVSGAVGGAAGGARVGKWVGGPYGAGAGALIGGLIGAFGGAALGDAVADWGYCILFHPLDGEQWLMLEQSEVVAPQAAAPEAAPAGP